MKKNPFPSQGEQEIPLPPARGPLLARVCARGSRTVCCPSAHCQRWR